MEKKIIRNKGQASIEFLSTYGWAIIIILIMIGGLSTFVIFNKNVFISDHCNFSPEVNCFDYTVTSTDATRVFVILQQTTGKPIYLSNFNCKDLNLQITGTGYYDDVSGSDDNLIPLSSLSSEQKKWDPRKKVTLVCELPGNPYKNLVGELVHFNLDLTFQLSDGGFNHTVSGDLVSKVI